MNSDYTQREAIRRYGDFMTSFGVLREKRRVVKAIGVYVRFNEALDLIPRIVIYRELTGRYFPEILEATNHDIGRLEELCHTLINRQ